jgi:hypothetical protein
MESDHLISIILLFHRDTAERQNENIDGDNVEWTDMSDRMLFIYTEKNKNKEILRVYYRHSSGVEVFFNGKEAQVIF